MDPTRTILVSDLDGVLVDTYAELQHYIWDRYGEWVPIKVIDRYMVYGPIYDYLREKIGPKGVPSREEFTAEISHCCWKNPDFYRCARPNAEYWQALLEWPGELYFLTSRPEHIRLATIEWLTRFGFIGSTCKTKRLREKRYRKLIHADDKAAAVQRIADTHKDCHVVVMDDKPETIEKLIALRSAKDKRIQPIMVSYPWTRGFGRGKHGFKMLKLDQIAKLLRGVK